MESTAMKRTGRLFGGFGILLLVVASVFYYWTEDIADGKRLHGGNRVEIHSSAGAVDVIGVLGDQIQVTVDGQSPSSRGAKVKIEKSHDPVLVEIEDLPQHARAEVQVPRNSSIAVNMSAGQLRIDGVQGDILSLLRSGQMIVNLDNTKDLKLAAVSVLAGNIHAPAF